MEKKLLLFVIALGISVFLFAQPAKDNAIKAAEAKQNELMTKLKTIDGIQQIVLKDAAGSNQFWIEQGKTIQYKKNKAISSTDTYSKCKKTITKKNGFEIKNFTFDEPIVITAEPNVGKNGKVDEHTYIVVYNIHKCQVKLYNSYKNEEGNDISATYDACNNLTMTWIVKISKKKEGKIEAVTLESIKAKANNDDELLGNLNKELNRLIKEWYDNNVPEYFTKQLQNEKILRTQLVPQVQTIKITALKREITVPVNSLPAVQIFVDPNKYMSPDSMYVNTPTAFLTFNPKSFIIKFSEDYKHGELTVEFEDGKLSGPQTLNAHERNIREALRLGNQVKDELVSIIEDFMSKPNTENTKRLKSLFAEKSTVEIAYITPNGIKRETRDYSKYINRLRSVKVDIEQVNDPTVNVDVDPWTAFLDYTQKTAYGKKCDITVKRIYLVKDESGSLKIEKIVVESDPVLCE